MIKRLLHKKRAAAVLRWEDLGCTALRGATPSVIAYGDATFPKGTAFCGGGKVSCTSKRRPLGGAGCERSEQTEGVPAARIPDRYSTINSVPAVMRAQPIRLLAVKGSCSTTKASARVMTTLSLSMGTTLDAAPTCKAW